MLELEFSFSSMLEPNRCSIFSYSMQHYSCPLLFFVTMTTMMMFLHRGQRHICLKRNKRKTVSSICDAGILFTMTNYHSGSFQRASSVVEIMVAFSAFYTLLCFINWLHERPIFPILFLNLIRIN